MSVCSLIQYPFGLARSVSIFVVFMKYCTKYVNLYHLMLASRLRSLVYLEHCLYYIIPILYVRRNRPVFSQIQHPASNIPCLLVLRLPFALITARIRVLGSLDTSETSQGILQDPSFPRTSKDHIWLDHLQVAEHAIEPRDIPIKSRWLS